MKTVLTRQADFFFINTLQTPFVVVESLDKEGPTLVNSWKFHQNDLHTSMRGKGAVFSFPEKCVNNGEEKESDVEDQARNLHSCSQKMIEKSVVLIDEPESRASDDIDSIESTDSSEDDGEKGNLHIDGKSVQDDAAENGGAIQVGVPVVRRLPKKCRDLDDGTTLCEERIVTEYYLPSDQAHKELEKALQLSPNNPFYEDDVGLTTTKEAMPSQEPSSASESLESNEKEQGQGHSQSDYSKDIKGPAREEFI